MSVVRRRGLGVAAVLLLVAAAVTAVLAGAGARPVDIRMVQPKAAPPETVSASATTTMPAIAPPPPAPDPVPAGQQVIPATTEPPAARPPAPTTTSKGALLPDLINGLCDYIYRDSGGVEHCVPWVLDMRDACTWLHEQGIDKIEVRGEDDFGLDLDLDGIACA
ncbi:hypothetical protein Lesp02_35840 [Lentzea sp. NBRC 105346]|uniref:hypothetical protein n=1 Tax=Lentzea sp. NBRC 105346 TaxID=3032205 RepID=UPI0024A196BC|nr:hypothetical protein [Lentzea sp. NBRC 105346]GLZ31396.1 hypothetical protein Lesp02_35840 [Lentzea sp. NBRC 105346]